MASIESPMLSITLLGMPSGSKTNWARLNVTCKVNFDHIEDCMMRLCPDGTWFALEAHCYGEDHPHDHSRDHELFFIGTSRFPGADPGNVGFMDDVPEAWLNEDPGPAPPEPGNPIAPPGTDEIYVRLTLFNMFSNTVVAVADTNVVPGVFS